jgi:hypothetical protein
MAKVFRTQGFDVQQAAITLTDPRFAKRFRWLPLLHPHAELLRSAAHRIVAFGSYV